jgi:hypothetical protein
MLRAIVRDIQKEISRQQDTQVQLTLWVKRIADHVQLPNPEPPTPFDAKAALQDLVKEEDGQTVHAEKGTATEAGT